MGFQKSNAQLSAADSAWFQQIFVQTKYADDSAFPGNWYLNDSIHSTTDFYNCIDSNFKFVPQDLQFIPSMNTDTTFTVDTIVNPTYNNYLFAFQQNNPLVYTSFMLNGKTGKAYSFLYPKDTAAPSDFAFLIVPGNGNNSATDVVQGNGYYNALCQLKNELRVKGDVYTFMKPNEDARAIYWDKQKIDHTYLFNYLDTINHHYGTNYMAELLATVKCLKKNYCKVIITGISEGGYAALLTSFMTEADGVMVSAGYSVGFDTSWSSYSILERVFDSLVFQYHRDTVKSLISSRHTKYFFTYGNYDDVNMMQAEHDFALTENFLADTMHCTFYYDYNYHVFPACNIIDTFVKCVLDVPSLSFYVSDSSNKDTLIASVLDCGTGDYKFDIYRNHTFYTSYNTYNVIGNIHIPITDSGMYYLKNIRNAYGDVSYCDDTIFFHKETPIANGLIQPQNVDMPFSYNNPVNDYLYLQNSGNQKLYKFKVYDVYGKNLLSLSSAQSKVQVDMKSFVSGIYFLHIEDGKNSYTGKIMKY